MELYENRWTKIFASTLIACLTLWLPACSDDSGGNGGGGGGGGTDTGSSGTGDGGGNGTDAGGQDTTNLPPSGESLTIAFVSHTRVPGPENPEVWQMWVTDEDCEPDSCDTTEVAGGGFTCQNGCAISPGMDYVLWVEPGTAGELHVAALSDSYEVASEDRILAQDVGAWEVGPDRVVYTRGTTLYSQPLASGNAQELMSLASQTRGLPGGFHYAWHVNRIIVNVPTSLTAMNLLEISDTDGTDPTLLYHFVADVEEGTGSFFQNQLQMSVSPDGNLVAIFTETRNSTNTCQTSDPSTCDPEFVCSGDTFRCFSEQLVLHIINRAEAGQLSVPGSIHRCSADNECGQYHTCDLTATDAAGLGACIPSKYVVGPYGRFACTDATDGPFLDAGEYEEIISGPMWRSDGSILFAASNGCVNANIDETDVAAIDVGLNGLELVVDSSGGNHGGDACYDTLEEEFVPSQCNIEIAQAVASPSGNTVVFIGSSVRSPTDTEVWIADAFGRGEKTDMTRELLTEVVDLQVFDR